MKILIKILLVLALAGGVAHADTPLMAAIESARFEAWSEAVRSAADLNSLNYGETGKSANYSEAIRLIENGADVNAKGDKGYTALHTAAASNAVKVAELLIKKGADVNFKPRVTQEVLMLPPDLAPRGTEPTLETITVDGDTPLHWAAGGNAVDVADLLINEGADVNGRNDTGDTPLHFAAQSNSVDVAKLLISKGADVNVQDRNGGTPLHLSIDTMSLHELSDDDVTRYQGAFAVSAFLISKGADVNAKRNDGDTALHAAVSFDAVQTAQLLISNGADVNGKSRFDEKTLLCEAILNDKSEIASVLKQAGAVAERGRPYPVDDSASQTNLITSAVNAAAMVAIVDEDNITETGAAAGQAVIDLSNASTARSKAKRAREKWERCEK